MVIQLSPDLGSWTAYHFLMCHESRRWWQRCKSMIYLLSASRKRARPFRNDAARNCPRLLNVTVCEFLSGAPQAEKVDAALHSLLMKLEPQRQHLACLGTWILYHNLRIMIQYLLSGFELELYSMHEYYYIYW